ncbi:hypothetical protein PsYK624_114230 [Phanerochaete sordida]|uniref:Uncharacterized protein n=1 Tax=Phanerochaete sordida TaxID=48140 RepID=A0A9P3GHW4_9APHY|nr:hypothetical protein PsYK624_114230 [Phanerochaete sordida]
MSKHIAFYGRSNMWHPAEDIERFVHRSVEIMGPWYIARKPGDSGANSSITIEVHLIAAGGTFFVLEKCTAIGVLLLGVPYTLIRIQEGIWICAELVDTSRSPSAPSTLHAVKWGVIHGECTSEDLGGARAAAVSLVDVAYLNGEEAAQRSQHTERYTGAFSKMRFRELGETCTFDI